MSKKINIAINGVGRIGRAALKIVLAYPKKFNLVAVNDLSSPETLKHLLKYDSAYGIYEKDIKLRKNKLQIGGQNIKFFQEKDPENLPWSDLNIDVVLECTGIFRTYKDNQKHLQAGAKKVVISAPAKDENIKTIVLGVNEKDIKKQDKVISCASCTTNCLSPVSKVLEDKVGIKKAIMTTIHSYTASQNLVDGPHKKDLRRARAAAYNFLPTSTGAAQATTKTIPELKNKFDGMAVRIPSLVGSLIDTTYVLKKKTSLERIKKIFKSAEKTKTYKGILKTSSEPLVSSDIVQSPASAIVDLDFLKLVDKDLLKVIAWYDNEWGYSNRLVELSKYLAEKK